MRAIVSVTAGIRVQSLRAQGFGFRMLGFGYSVKDRGF